MAIITISRGTLSGGKMLAKMLCERLGYECVSREIIIKAADDYAVPEGKLFEAIQKNPNIFQKLTFERERYLAYIQASLCEYAVKDNIVYHGHAGHFLLRGVAHVLRIRIVADLSYRIKVAMEQLNMTEKEAEKYLEKVDSERIKWTKFLYGKDWRSPDLYDLVFNLERLDLECVCDIVQCAVSLPQFKATPESKKAMYDLLIKSRVRAALARISKIRLEKLEIEADDGKVVISGRTKSEEISKEVSDIISKIPGVVSVENKVELDYRNFQIE